VCQLEMKFVGLRLEEYFHEEFRFSTQEKPW
jgi:hypothetical protein